MSRRLTFTCPLCGRDDVTAFHVCPNHPAVTFPAPHVIDADFMGGLFRVFRIKRFGIRPERVSPPVYVGPSLEAARAAIPEGLRQVSRLASFGEQVREVWL